MKLLFVAILFSITSAASASFVNWSSVKTCPQGYELLVGESWAPYSEKTKTFQANLSGDVLQSLEIQLNQKIYSSVVLESTRWGSFTGFILYDRGFYDLKITEQEERAVFIEIFSEGVRKANYYLTNCY